MSASVGPWHVQTKRNCSHLPLVVVLQGDTSMYGLSAASLTFQIRYFLPRVIVCYPMWQDVVCVLFIDEIEEIVSE